MPSRRRPSSRARRYERASTSARATASNAAAAPTATSAVVAVTPITILFLGWFFVPPSHCRLVQFRTLWLESHKALEPILTSPPLDKAEPPEPCAFRRLTLEGELRYHARPVGRVARPRQPLLCPHPSTQGAHADRQSAGPKGQGRAEGEGEDPCASRRAAEARRLHARVHDHPEEAELGSPEGRARPADQRHGGRRVHPG